MKNLWFCLVVLISTTGSLMSQTTFELVSGTSKADDYFLELDWQYALNNRWTIGLQTYVGQYEYRFIDARQVDGGVVAIAQLILAAGLAEGEKYRFDFFLKPGLRWLQSPQSPEQPLIDYPFQNSQALVIDPGFLLNLYPTDKWSVQTGVAMSMAFQWQPETIFEQFPSSHLVLGTGWQIADQWHLFLQAKAGPSSGASGDSEKFFWEQKIGVRWDFGTTDRKSIIGL